MFRPCPYDDVKKYSGRKNNTIKTTPFLSGGPGAFFQKNPYFCEDIKPTYKISYRTKYKGTVFVPPSTIKHVSDTL